MTARVLYAGLLFAWSACAADQRPAEPPLARVDLPFPCDIFTESSEESATGVQVALGRVPAPVLAPVMGFNLWGRERIQSWTEDLDGFSTFAPLFWLASEAADPATLGVDGLTDGAPIFLVNLQEGSRHHGERTAINASYALVDDEDLGSIHVLHVTPLAPLRPGALHGVVVTKQVRNPSAEPLATSGFFEVLAGRRDLEADSPLRGPMTELRQRARPLFDHLATQGLALEEVAHAFVFTTQSSRALLTEARAYLRGAGAPSATVRWRDAFTPADFAAIPEGVSAEDLDGISSIVTGVIEVPDFRDPDGGIASPLRHEALLEVPCLIALPRDHLQSSPLVVLQHGHGGTKELALHVAPYFAAQGIATAAIDHMGHGALEHTGSFIDILDLRRFHGNMVQTAVNALRLIQVLGTLQEIQAGDTVHPVSSGQGIGYIGESLGGITGVPVAAVEPDVSAAVFNVAGGGLAASLAGSYLKLMNRNKLLLRFGFIAVFQMLLDRMDPVSFGGALHAEAEPATHKAVLLQNVASDSLGTETVETLATAIGATYVCPCPAAIALPRLKRTEAPAPSPGLFFFEQGRHGFLLAESSDPAASAAVRRQAAHFFGTHFAGEGATIADPATLD